MARVSKAERIGEVLQELAYHDFELLGGVVYIRDYDPGPLANEKRIRDAANNQREKHLHLHHGLSPDGGGEQVVQDDWCYQCTTEFLASTVGKFSKDILEASDRGGGKLKNVGCEKVSALVLDLFRSLDEHSEKKMREATDAVRIREGLGAIDGGALDKLIREWDQDEDRVTDFYAARIGHTFPSMVDRAEKLNVISTRAAVPESVQRYLVEASRCYVFGQYFGCLFVCRAALELALGDFLVRHCKGAELKNLAMQGHDGLWERLKLAKSLENWKLKPTLDDVDEVRKWASKGLHELPLEPSKCKDLYFVTRGALQELYS